jgi:oxygen-dependent protoporphyrinogen oxidase
MKRVVVVGGGITGLATAHALVTGARERGDTIDVRVFEGAPRLGGSIRTERRDGYTIDGGPDSWVATKPHATALAKSLGLEAELMPTVEETRRVYIAWNGGLHPLPEGLVLAVPTQVMPMLRSPLFSWAGKLRMGMEPLVPRRTFGDDDDESIGDFVTRRLGREMTERLAAPLLGGIFAGDATAISIRATFPQFVEMEQKHGSLVRAMRAARRPTSSGKPPSAFVSLRGGVGSLIDALASALGDRVHTGARVLGVSRDGEAWRVAMDGDVLVADDVVLATPAHATSTITRDVDGALASELAEIPYASTATVFLAFRRADVKHPLDGVGFLVPRPLGRPILAATWVSSKWASRAPEGGVLMRAFFGGAWGEDLLAKGDDELVRVAREELGALMALDAEPIFTRVFRFDRASPQPVVGHLARMKRVRARLEALPGMHLAATGFDGVGIPDCVRQANDVAARILAR